MPDCRYCGEPEAYDTGFTVECCNHKCDHYSEDQRILRADKALKKIEEEEREKFLKEYLNEDQTDPDITPTFHWGIDTTLDSDLD
jgi:hypothetical protein